MTFDKIRLAPALGLLCLLSAPAAQANFLEMPDTTEVPAMERDSMLKDLDIPTVRERDPDPMAGPRLNITQFRVQGIVEYPELGITRQSLNDLVESIRFELMSEGELLESGYTLDEVAEISDLMVDIEQQKRDQHVGPEEVQRLVFLIREQRRRRGVTLGMVETVADTITRYYRERGFILAKAYIPEQRVRDGVVTLTLLLGNLGEVEVHNNKRYRPRTIENIFEPVLGEPITASDIETRLFYVNDMPGLSAQAFFEPGTQVGDTKLSVNVVDETYFNGNVRADNHGTSNTGEYRLYTDGYWHNPGRIGDQLHIGVLATFEPADSLYGSIHYRLPLFSPRLNLSFGGSTNAFVTRPSDALSLVGESRVLDAALNYTLKRSRVKNYAVELRYADIDTDIQMRTDGDQDLGLDDDEYDSSVQSLDLIFSFDVVQESIRALHQGSARLTYGEFAIGGDSDGARQDTPAIFGYNYSLLKFVPVPFTSAQSRVIFKSSGQYSVKGLASTMQMSLTGPNRMRAFPVSLFNGDRGLYLGTDWIFNGPRLFGASIAGQPLADMFQPFVFGDLAYGHIEGVGTGDPQQVEMANAGVGLRFNFKNLRGNFTYARALHYQRDLGRSTFSPTAVVQTTSSLEDRSQLYLDLLYSF